MLQNLKGRWDRQFQRWLDRRLPPRDHVVLNRHNILTVPTRNGLLFVLCAALIFIAAINYAVSLAFGLAFLMVSVFILAILHAFNNLSGLRLDNQPSPPVFCGEQATFKVLVSRGANKQHESLELNFADGPISHCDLIDNDQERVDVFTLATRRGYFKPPRLRITTFFPLGLCRAWSVMDLNLHCLVYPKPIPHRLDGFTRGSSGASDAAISKEGSEDFCGLRDYLPGDPMRQVAWKNVARGQGMQVKQFVDYVDNKVWLDWDMFYGFGTEERLSRLCYCVLKLARTGDPFGLKLPGVEISPGCGLEHRNKLLRTLALYGVN